MKNNVMIPELEAHLKEVYQERKDRKIDKIKWSLERYMTARERLERERARKKTFRYRIGAWFRRGVAAQ